MKHAYMITALALLTACPVAFGQAAGAGADYNKRERERIAAESKKQRTYSESEIRESVKSPSGATVDVRRVGVPNGSTLDKPARRP